MSLDCFRCLDDRRYPRMSCPEVPLLEQHLEALLCWFFIDELKVLPNMEGTDSFDIEAGQGFQAGKQFF